jgi:hypothetical protein
MPVQTRPVLSKLSSPGPFLAKIVSHLDPFFMGTLQVELLKNVGNIPNRDGQIFQVKYLTPFYGVTSVDHLGKNADYNDTQKSYGMWMVPPDVGTIVMVIFVEGDPKQGYWIGCVQDQHMNFMIPGLAATELSNGSGKVPVAEFNKQTNDLTHTDTTKIKKPVHPFTEVLKAQGLIEDEVRGVTTSSARREVPSTVFGISTPGPVDRKKGAKKGKIGKSDSRVETFVSRLGGSTFVMDDGDANFLRKTYAADGPPEYSSVDDGGSGLTDVPHNELIRIRTRTGHQILLHNSEDLIYIANAKGTAWIELTSKGKIDIYAADSISMHTVGDFNITADKNINLTAKENINLYSEKSVFVTADENYEIYAKQDGKLTAGGSTNILSVGSHKETANGIYMNGVIADAALPATKAPRVPDQEPWPDHENLHGTDLKDAKITDTFKKIGK